ncbi:MAG: TolB family protein, partial [Acidimicrobiales bacterium]
MAHSVHPTRRRAALAAAAALALVITACGDDSDDPSSSDTTVTTTTVATTTTEALASLPPGVPGQLMFSSFDERSHDFRGTYISAPDGSELHELTLPGPEGGGGWSHDGQHIAVMTIRDDDRVGTAIITPDGTVERVLDIPDPTLNLVCATWSPDDTRLACEGFNDSDLSQRGIYSVLAADGSDLQRLTTSPEGLVDFPGGYSPDGTQFVFLRTEDEEEGTLMVVDVAGGEPRTLIDTPVEDSGAFSPDGTQVLTAGGDAILVLDLDGTVVHEIRRPGRSMFGAAWSPDGQWIAFSSGLSGSRSADIFI